MSINTLTISDLRNIERSNLTLSPTINLIIGENASGKTSLLEALHLLLLSKSFRTHSTETIIQQDKPQLQIVAQLQQEKQISVLGIQKSKRKTKIKFAGAHIASAAQLAKIQPLSLLTAEIHQLILGGPKQRRQLIDWLLFHVEQNYYKNWQVFNKCLKQRNVLLRKKMVGSQLDTWDEKLISAATLLEEQRLPTVKRLIKKLQQKVEENCEFNIEISYERGWGDAEYSEVIDQSRETDLRHGYTRKGPHRTDLIINRQGKLAAQTLSRGQIKHLAIAVELSKIQLLQEQTGKQTILLIDDLAAELDTERKKILATMLLKLPVQMFITSTEIELIPSEIIENAKVFHVERGIVKEVIQ